MTLDHSRSTVGFLIRHMGVATVRGSFSSFGADIETGSEGLCVRAEIDVASVDTGEPIRDARLRTEFFAAPDFPSIAFDGVAANGSVTGSLTIRGVTRPIRLALSTEPLEGSALRMRAEGRIRRSDFGLDWDALRQAGRLLVADHVRVFADAVLVREVDAQPERDQCGAKDRDRHRPALR